MAITLVSSPRKYCPANYTVAWEFSLDNLGTPPTRIDFGFALYDESGIRLTEDESYKPQAIDTNFKREFAAIVSDIVYTSFPAESASSQIDTNILKKIRIKYGPVDFNSETCESFKSIDTESSLIYLVSANVNTQTQAVWGTSSGFSSPRTGLMLHQRPDKWQLLHGSKDYIWLLGAGQVVLTYYNGASVIGSAIVYNLTGADTVKYICLDYLVHGISTKPTHATVFFSDGVNEKSHRIDYCCCVKQDDYLGILFLEPFGGRSMLATGIGQSYSVDRTASVVNKSFDLSQTTHKSGGNSIYIPKGSLKLTFKTQIEASAGFETMLKNFLSSPGHHAQKGYGGNLKWEKFILEPGSEIIKEKNKLIDFSFSGYISESINTQRQDI